MLKILFLTHRFPFPPDRGDRIRSHALIRHLAGRHRVSLAAVVDRLPSEEHMRAAENLCASVDVGRVDHFRRIVSPCYFSTTVPITLPLFFSSALRARIRHRLRTETFDLIFIYCSAMAPYVLSDSAVPKVVDFVDVDSEKWFDYARATPVPMKWIYWREGVLLRRYERRVAQACGHVFVAAEREAQVLRRLAPEVPVTTIQNGVDRPTRARPPGDSRRLVFTGVMDYRPNVDAMTYFVHDIWPLVRASVPSAELAIVGQNPSRELRRLARAPGVTVTGWVKDVTPYIESAAVFVAPLRLGRGVQNKILEAMAAGVAVVSTPTGAAGIAAVPGRDMLVADTSELFAAHTVSLLLNAERRQDLGRSAEQFVRRNHQWSHQVERLERILLQVAEGVSTHATT